MKWSIKYIVSALPFLFTACSGDWLDLDPSTSVTSDNAIQSLEDLSLIHISEPTRRS